MPVAFMDGDVTDVRHLSYNFARQRISDSDMDEWNNYGRRKYSDSSNRRESDTGSILTEDTASFIIGDIVWVGGVKRGRIAYIGETQFAKGEWAGIVLDEPVGKNDGTVSGHRYFQCDPLHGTFCRLTRLTRKSLVPIDPTKDCWIHGNTPPRCLTDRQRSISPFQSSSKSSSPGPGRDYADRQRSPSPFQYPSSNKSKSPSPGPGQGQRYVLEKQRSQSPLQSMSLYSNKTFANSTPAPAPASVPMTKPTPAPRSIYVERRSSSPLRNKSKSKSPSPGPTRLGSPAPPLRVGDRVVVQNSSGKIEGLVRFIGTTFFARGEWLGIELDRPVGKNDGSVAGTRMNMYMTVDSFEIPAQRRWKRNYMDDNKYIPCGFETVWFDVN